MPGGGYYPWWIYGFGAGAGYAGYYGGMYSGYYDYDPWFGGYPDPGGGTYSSGGGTSSVADEGTLRLKIKPRNGEVYVDGYYVGVVDDFDGMFQKLHVESGVHRVEVRAPGYESLVFEVRISPDHLTTYQGELTRVP